MNFYTYAHYRASDGKLFYIGKGTGTRYKSSDTRNAFWASTVKKHGFTSEILARWDSDQEASEHEIFLIACFILLTTVIAAASAARSSSLAMLTLLLQRVTSFGASSTPIESS